MKSSAQARMQLLLAFFLFALGSNAQNPVVTENALTGNPSTEWDISGAGDLSIQGFATQISVNKGQTINFKIKSSTAYTIDIYRIGWYGGNGARKVSTSNPVVFDATLPQSQPTDLYDAVTGKVSCANWALSAHWNVPANAVSGVYLAKLTKTVGGGSSHIAFVVRDDNGGSDMLFKTSDATWQAYNGYGGSSLYVGSTPGYPNGHATKVSYDRPFTTRNGGGGGGPSEDWIFNAEYPMIRWLERNGYNVSYTTDVDLDKDPIGITPTGAGGTYAHKIFLSVGHDEYWSLAQRTKIENARNAGVHMAFFSGNEVYWKTRWEDNHRTLVCYKEGTMGENFCGFKCDPLTGVWTGLWRDGSPASYPGSDGGKPENALTGQISWGEGTASIIVPDTYKNMRFWRNTTVSTLGSGQSATLPNGTLGYEYDFEQPQYSSSNPPGRVILSSTGIASRLHKLSVYKHSSGALVFGAGTVQWSWGLDDKHDRGSAAPSVVMQQATLNLFADMGVQAATKQANLVAATASTDLTAPSITISSPANNAEVSVNSTTVISGTATDQNAVAGIEYSTDGGITWQLAGGTTSWSFSFLPTVSGTYIIKVRGFDDSGNLPVAGTEVSITVYAGVAPPPPPPPVVVPDEGNGGPVLLVTSTANPFSKFPVEILRAEGWNAYKALDISAVTSTELNKYDVVIIGDIAVTSTQAALFSAWTTNNGGTLIAFSPDPNLYSLFGITSASGTLADKYIKVNNSSAPGAGIVSQTIQYHGSADLFTVNAGTNIIATLYSTATAATAYPAVTLRNVGTNGGQAIAFTYDLARSIVYTRQGNPAWSNQNRDGLGPIRSNDLFFGASSSDPQPDYVDLSKVAIPQADEQMRLLSNLMLMGNFDKKPLPKVWFLPKGKKAAIVMTGDDHSNGGTIGRFNQYKLLGPNTANDVLNWNAIRGTSYIYPGTPITNTQITNFQNEGFEIGLHLNTNCADFTETQWNNFWDNQTLSLKSNYPSIANTLTHRTHCIAWGGPWATTAKLSAAKGVRMDVNYYYWPGTWLENRPGMFTGSGMPMRFADLDGSFINTYQVTTQMTDESGQEYPLHANALLDSALGAPGYYGVFCANMHTDFTTSGDPGQQGSDRIITSATARQIPVVSAKQMLDWIDGRNNSYFSNIVWGNNQLGFTLTADSKARNMKAMLPMNTGLSTFQGITKDGVPLTFTTETIKGVQYAFFDGTSGNYVANYSAIIPDVVPPVVTNIQVSTSSNGTATVTWTTDELSDSRVDYGTSAGTLSSNTSDVTLTTAHTVTLSGLAPLTLFYFRVSSRDASNNSATSPLAPAVPLEFTIPINTICAADDLAADFSLGNTGTNTAVTSTGNGEIALTQITVEEAFTATTIPPGWNSANWAAGGNSTFAGGIATVNGARLYTTQTFQPGSTVEFSARFTLGDFENIGFALNNNFDPYWITVGRGGAGAATDVYARTSDGISISLGTNYLNNYHTYKISWGATDFKVFVDGVLKATVSKTYTTPLIFLVSDLNNDATTVSIDFFRNITGGYLSSGTFISRVFSLGSYTGSTTVSWNSVVPVNTGLTISVRSGNTLTPDATWSAFAPVSNNQSLTPAGSFIQYQAQLTSTSANETPLLNDIKLDCPGLQTPLPPLVTLNPLNIATCENSSAVTFTSSATGTPVPTVQWQVSTNGTTWNDIAGANNASLQIIPTVSANGNQYRAVWTNSSASQNSNAAILTVTASPSSPTGSSAQIFCGAATVANLSATGTDIKWYSAASGGTALPSSTALVNGSHYYASQTIAGCESAARLDVIVSISNSSTVTLDGSGSTGTISSYAWTRISGPNTPVITSPASVTTTVTGLIQGTYVFQLSLNGGASTSQVTVNVDAPASPITANAGSDRVITLPASSVSLDGNGSTGTISGYTWTRISGPNTPVITSPSAVTTTVTGLIQGVYTFQLSVTNGITVVNDVVQVTVNAAPTGSSSPVIAFTNTQTTRNGNSVNSLTGVPAGALLVLTIANENDAVIPSPTVTSSPALTWTKRADAQATSSGNAEIYTAIYPAGGSINVTTVWSNNAMSTVVSVITNYDPVGYIGASSVANAQSAPSVAITTTLANSLLIGVTSDWNATSGTSRIYRDGATESLYDFATGSYSGYHYRKPATAIGTYTEGLTAPTGMRAGTAFLEIKGAVATAETLVAYAGNNQSILASTPPTGPSSQSFCGIAATVANLTATGTGTIKWYSSATGGIPLSSTDALVDGNHYYASQTIGACESASRLDVTVSVTINPVNAPTGSTAQSLCGVATVASLTATGTNIKWYNTPTGGIALSSSDPLVSGSHYYASQTIGACESTSRLDVTFTSIPGPTSPTGSGIQVFCGIIPTISDLTATGTDIKWYSAASGGTALPSSTALVNGSHYYASQTIAGCESVARLDVTASIVTPSSVTLDGSGSTGTISSYAWTRISGPNTPVITSPASVTTTVTGLIQGTYVFQLSLNGGASTSQVTVNVSPPASPITANAGNDRVITLPASSVSLDGNGSTGTISGYTWTRISGPNTPVITSPSAVTTTVTGLIQGVYTFQLSVTNGITVVNDVVQVTVNAAPTGSSSPVIAFTNTQTTRNGNSVNSLTGVPAGALLVLTIAQEDDAVIPSPTVTSSPALTWTKRADAQRTSSGNAEVYTAIYPAGGSINVTTVWSNNAMSTVVSVITNYDPVGYIGASRVATRQTVPSVAIPTTLANSLLIGVTSDWNARSGASRIYRDGATESLYDFATGIYTGYHYRKPTTAIGTYTEGLTAPTSMRAGTAFLEIKGPSGAIVPLVAYAGNNQSLTCPGPQTSVSNNRNTALPTLADKSISTDITSLGIYPNPTNGLFNIVLNNVKKGKVLVRILDARGVIVMVKELNIPAARFMTPINLGSAAKGIYYVQVINQDGILTGRVIKE